MYVHSPHDYHQVHQTVAKCSIVAASDIPQLYFYESASSTTSDFTPNAYADITNTLSQKLKCIRTYKRQIKKFSVNSKAITAMAKYRYMQGKVGNKENGAAEAFFIHRLIH